MRFSPRDKRIELPEIHQDDYFENEIKTKVVA